MKRTNTFLMFLVLALTIQFAHAQKFLTDTYDEVQVTTDVEYGINATMLFFAQAGEAIPESLKLDVYEPVGDSAEIRPLVLVFHGGSFLPPEINGGIAGTKVDSSVVEICTRLAKHGYTAASVDYRLGWNPLVADPALRALGEIQAIYRGMQDGRTAIRFFKKNMVEDGNQFKVDTSRITTFGVGSGGYLTLALVGLSDYTEIITTTHGSGKFLLSTEPVTPMVVEAYHGDIEGKVTTVVPDATFGMPAGDTSNYANHTEYSSDFQLCANVGGAIGDISWLEAGDQPIISIQSAFDQITPYEDEIVFVHSSFGLRVQGSLIIAQKQNELGNHQLFIDANFDDETTMTAIDHSATAQHDYLEALYPITNPPNTFGQDEGVVINWWNPGDLSPFSGLPWDQIPHPVDPNNLTYHTYSELLNVGMGPAKAKANIDTILNYFAPRAYIVLDLDALVATDNIRPKEVNLTVVPNPVANQVILKSAEETPMQSIRIYDINGRTVRAYDDINFHYFYISRDDIAAGTYVISIQFEKSRTSKKLIFN